jgi:hypothetical protein
MVKQGIECKTHIGVPRESNVSSKKGIGNEIGEWSLVLNTRKARFSGTARSQCHFRDVTDMPF